MTTRDVTVALRANTAQYERSMRRAVRNTADLAGNFGMVGKAAGIAGLAAGAAVVSIGAAATKVGFEAATAFADFELSLSRIEGLVGISEDALAGMTDELKEISVETARGPQELADALFFITSAGLEGEAAMEALEVSAKAATAGLGETAIVADVVTSAVNAYGDQISGATEATDVLVATVREGKAEAPQLAASLGRVIPIAAQMGITFDQVGAAVAAMTRTGLDANESATALRGVMNSLLAPSAEAEMALAGVGTSAAELRNIIREQGLLSGLQAIQTAFAGNDDAITSVFGNVRALTGVLSLLGENAADTERIFGSLAESTGSLDSAFDAAADTGAFAFEQAKVRIENALLEVGEDTLPKLADAVEELAPSIGPLVESLGDLAITLVDLGSVAVPKVADFLGNLPQYGRGIEKLGLQAQQMFGTWLQFQTLGIVDIFDGADKASLAFLNTQVKVHNALRDGHDIYAVAFTAVKDMAEGFTLTTENAIALQNQLGFTDAEMVRLLSDFQAQADAAGLYGVSVLTLTDTIGFFNQTVKEQKDAVFAAANEGLDPYEMAIQQAAKATEEAAPEMDKPVGPLGELRAALAAASEEADSLSSAMLELTNPVFKAQKAVERMRTAEEKAAEVREDSTASAEELAAAELAVVEATYNAQAALDGVDSSNLEATIAATQAVLGGTRQEALDLLEALGLIDGQQVEAAVVVRTSVTGPLAGTGVLDGETFNIGGKQAKALGGPVSEGVPYTVGEMGPELFVPDRSGYIVPTSDLRRGNFGDDRSKTVNITVNGSDRPAEDGQVLLLASGLGAI